MTKALGEPKSPAEEAEISEGRKAHPPSFGRAGRREGYYQSPGARATQQRLKPPRPWRKSCSVEAAAPEEKDHHCPAGHRERGMPQFLPWSCLQPLTSASCWPNLVSSRTCKGTWEM